MRKGFILTLTALATTFLVTSAVALGPTVSGVPDVYIGPEAAVGATAEIGVNTFRYSSALTLWDYVKPGVTTGDGSGSNTLFQAWSAKDATLSGGTGSYLAAGGVHYSIIQEGNATDALFLTPTKEVGDAGWETDINAAFNGEGSALADYALDVAGALTFRNIDLSPLPEAATYPAPAGTGVLDVQEATLYVSDTNTTPGADKILMVTVKTGPDFLSGGLKWNLVTDHTNTAAFTGVYSFKSDGPNFVIDPTDATMTNTGSSLRIQTPVTSAPTTSYFYYAEFGAAQAGLSTANLYRATADITAPGGSLNPTIILQLNGRGTTGFGYLLTNPAATTASSPGAGASSWSAFLRPDQDGDVQAQFIVFDPNSSVGGLVEATNYQVQSLPFQDVLDSASVVQATKTSFTVASDGANTATEWGYFEQALSANGNPTWSHSPANGATNTALVMSATTNGNTASNIGYQSFQGPDYAIPTTLGKLVLIRAKLSTSAATSDNLPAAWLHVDTPTAQSGKMIERGNDVTSGPTSTARDYYLVFEAKDTTAQFNMRWLADKPSMTGDIHLTELEVLDTDMPLAP
jgi:hypothetical protein